MLRFCDLSVEQFNSIQPLWERQREFHVSCTAYFAEDVRRRRFDERKAELLAKAGASGLHVDVCYAVEGEAGDVVEVPAVGEGRAGDEAKGFAELRAGGGRIVGYCVSSISGGADSAGAHTAGPDYAGRVGEIDSLFVLDEFRGRGIGTELVRRALVWLREREPGQIIVVALAENVAATEFYKRFGLMPRAVVSELVRETDSGAC